MSMNDMAASDDHKRDYKKNYPSARYAWGLLGVLFSFLTFLFIVVIFLPKGEGGDLRPPPRWFAIVPIAGFGGLGLLCIRRSLYWHRMISSSK
jgi:hypothetical protein